MGKFTQWMQSAGKAMSDIAQGYMDSVETFSTTRGSVNIAVTDMIERLEKRGYTIIPPNQQRPQ